MSNPTDWRALCAIAVELWDADCDMESVISQMRTALSQPEPEGVTDEELDDQFFEHCYTDDFGNELMERQQFRKGARAVLARYPR
jgi:hypothetical protein